MPGLYRCKAKLFLIPSGWKKAIPFSESEIVNAKVSIEAPGSGRTYLTAANYQNGFPLYRDTSTISVTLIDKFGLKGGWTSLISSSNFEAPPEIELDSTIEVSSLLGTKEKPKGFDEIVNTNQFGLIVLELSYDLAKNTDYYSQRFFFRLTGSKITQGQNYTNVTLTGSNFLRGLMQNTRANTALISGTPLDVAVEHQLDTSTKSLTGGTGNIVKDVATITTEPGLENPGLIGDKRNNGAKPAAVVSEIEKQNNVLVVEDPREPSTMTIVNSIPSVRTVFYLGRGLYEGCSITQEALNSGRTSLETGVQAERQKDTSSNVSALESKDESLTNIILENPKASGLGSLKKEALKIYNKTVRKDSKGVYSQSQNPVKIGDSGYTGSGWMESRIGLDSVWELGYIDTEESVKLTLRKNAHAAIDGQSSDDKVKSLFGGEIIVRESNTQKGDGKIVVKTEQVILDKSQSKTFTVFEEYLHCVDHLELGKKVKPKDIIAKVSDKVSNKSNKTLPHLHATYYIENYRGKAKVYVNPILLVNYAHTPSEADVTISSSTSKEADTERKELTPTGGSSSWSESEFFNQIVCAEATREDLLGKALVARAILNRVSLIKSGKVSRTTYGKGSGPTIMGVIFAENQFQPVTDKRLYNTYSAQVKSESAQAIELAQNPTALLEKIKSSGLNENVLFATFFATPEATSDVGVEPVPQAYRWGGHNFWRSKVDVSFKPSDFQVDVQISNTGNTAESTGTTGTSNTVANAGASGPNNLDGAVLETSFVGIPRCLFIQPAFTYLVMDSNFDDWSSGVGIDPKVPIPKKFAQWAITAIDYEWKGDLRVSLVCKQPRVSSEAFLFDGPEFSEIREYSGDYYRYIRSFTDLCYTIKTGPNAGRNSCSVIANSLIPTDGSGVSSNSLLSISENSAAGGLFDERKPSFMIPASGLVSSVYGPRWGKMHWGIDISGAGGKGAGGPIYAAASGKVTKVAFQEGGAGKYVVIEHSGRYSTVYMHLYSIGVTAGQKVTIGDQIGIEGSTGGSTGTHLHFEIHEDGKKVNPAKFLPALIKGRTVKAVRPSLTISQKGLSAVVSAMKKKNYRVFEGKEINIVGIRGATLNSDGSSFVINSNLKNQFNDVIIAFSGNGQTFRGFLSSTEPGLHYVKNPLNSGGAAFMVPGQYTSWTVGIHTSPNPSRGSHEALVQKNPVNFVRDVNRDYSPTEAVQSGNIGLNIHWGYDSPIDSVETASAGCQIIKNKADQKEFMKIVKTDPNYLRDRNFLYTYTLLEAKDLQ